MLGSGPETTRPQKWNDNGELVCENKELTL